MRASKFPALVQGFFTERLRGQLDASSHTVEAYRDTFRLLFQFSAVELRKAPSSIAVEDLDVRFLSSFLDHLETKRGNSPRTRNNRLSAIHAFFRYVLLKEPSFALQCQRILAIPAKRYQKEPVEFLTEDEAKAVVHAPGDDTWIGQRDRALLLVAIQTGLRNAELSSLRRRDIEFGTGAHVKCIGKGRKLRCTPLRPDVVVTLKAWFGCNTGDPKDPVFPTRTGGHLSADAIQRIVRRHVASALRNCPSLKGKRVTPHTLRHSAAMHMLQRGVDTTVIALWLGHESIETTKIYLHADMGLKERALSHASDSGVRPRRFQPSDPLLVFLENL